MTSFCSGFEKCFNISELFQEFKVRTHSQGGSYLVEVPILCVRVTCTNRGKRLRAWWAFGEIFFVKYLERYRRNVVAWNWCTWRSTVHTLWWWEFLQILFYFIFLFLYVRCRYWLAVQAPFHLSSQWMLSNEHPCSICKARAGAWHLAYSFYSSVWRFTWNSSKNTHGLEIALEEIIKVQTLKVKNVIALLLFMILIGIFILEVAPFCQMDLPKK